MAKLSLIVLMAVVVLMVSSSPSALAQDIPSCVENLDICVPFVNSTSSPLPTAECCNPFKMALKDIPCICGFFADPDLLNALGLNRTLVLGLPEKCGVSVDLETACNSGVRAAPPPPENSRSPLKPKSTPSPSSTPTPTPTPLNQARLPTPSPPPERIKKMVIITPIVIPSVIIVVLAAMGIGICLIMKKRKKKKESENLQIETKDEFMTPESLQFDLATLEAATNKFSSDNKIGEGGFGGVYKGTLSHEQNIAVKRLSKSSSQGNEEFKNEVMMVAKLQHRNLVRLLGFCLEKEERLLVYEYVANKSLDYHLFDPTKQGQLTWSRRCNIIKGITRGMLYLHEDSRLKIIHRDLKASNILLDAEMNPKISDFGIARIFNIEQTRYNTSRIVGTYGYMAPEYAMHGQFSAKSDVYSFGVLALEIVSGKRIGAFYESETGENLLSYAWKHWREGRQLEFMDQTLRESCTRDEVIRCIHIGLLCVQEDISRRPTMAAIMSMLNSDHDCSSFATPQRPAFLYGTYMETSTTSRNGTSSVPWTQNEALITEPSSR